MTLQTYTQQHLQVKSQKIPAYYTKPSQVVAQVEPTEVEFIDIDGFYNFEAQVNGEIIAQVCHDAIDDVNCWLVEVNGLELHRTQLWSEACNYVQEEYAKGKLPQSQELVAA